LQWFRYCEKMVMPPSNTIRAHSVLLSPERRSQEALDQAQRLLGRAVAPVESALEGREYLTGDFSAADVMLGHALFMANRLGQVSEDMPNGRGNVNRVAERSTFQIAIKM
jgi:glutathione S-transferase